MSSSTTSYCSFPNRIALIMLSLLCTIITLTEQAVALTILSPTLTASVSFVASNESLVENLPLDMANNSSNLKAVVEQRSRLNQQSRESITPGQQVINAVPDKERNDFVMHQLTVALKSTYENKIQQRFFKNLDDLEKYYGNKLTTLQNVPIYENYPIDLLTWVGHEFNLNHQQVYAQLRSRTEIWCTSQGVCYVYGYGTGIGCFCCPF